MMTVWFFLYILFIVAPLSTFIHELGHAYGAKLAKAENIELSVGLGKKLVSISLKQYRLSIHMFFFLGGSVKNRRDLPYQRRDIMIITMLGPLNNALFALIFYGIHLMDPSPYMIVLAMFNFWLAIVNIIPFKLWGKESDGFILLKEMLKG